MKNLSLIITGLIGIIIGIIIGGYFFSQTQPRFIYRTDLNPANSAADDILGYLTSIGLNKLPTGFIPHVISESEQSIVINHPFPEADLHYLILPKKDLRNLTDLTDENEAYVTDCLRQATKIINDQALVNYRIITNGPGYQNASYLHFHLLADL